MTEKQVDDHPPTPVEWAATILSALLVVFLVGVLVWDARREHAPAAFSTRVMPLERRGAQMLVPVEVTNTGDEAAKDVRVGVNLRRSGVPDSAVAELQVDWLAGKSSHRVVAILAPIPEGAMVVSEVRGYTEP